MQRATKMYPEQQTMVFLNDKDGNVAKFSAKAGHKAFAYHKSHTDDEGIDFYKTGGGMLCKHGQSLPEFLKVVNLSLTENEQTAVVVRPDGLSPDERAVMDKTFRASDLFTNGRCSSIMYTL